MQIKFKLDEYAYMPTKAHAADAGFDLKARKGKLIRCMNSKVFDTGVHVEIPEGYVGYIQGRSGLNVNHGIVCPTGVIDSGYSGSIKVKLYNWSTAACHVERGDRIAQLIIQPLADCELVEVEELSKTERGDNGFGSTGH